jgi:hypothetical protein
VDAVFFETPTDLRAWLKQHHATADELLIGFYKKGGQGGHHLRPGAGRGALLRLDRRGAPQP